MDELIHLVELFGLNWLRMWFKAAHSHSSN